MSSHVVTYAVGGLALCSVVYLTTLLGAAWPVSLAIALSVFSSHWDRLGIPIGIDRLLLAIGLAAVVLRLGRERTRPALRLGGTHLVLLAAAGFALCSALWAGSINDHVGKFRLLDAFGLLPYVAFALAPVIFRTDRDRRILLGVLVVCGGYLGLTTLAEASGLHQLVFPKYILDPHYGIHANRARGPFVEAVANGLALFMCAVASAIAAGALRSPRSRTAAKLVALLCLAAIPVTYTRAVWIGAIAGTLVALACTPDLRRWLLPTLATGAAAVWIAIFVVPGLGAKLDSRYHEQGPIYVRENTNAAALALVRTNPLVGVGWNEYVPRSVDAFRSVGDVPPLKGLYEPVHNVFLSRAAELGLLGGGLWLLALLVGVGQSALRRAPPALRRWRTGLIAIATAWVCTGLLGPLDYAFPTLLLWVWAGIVASPVMSARRAPTAAPAS